MDETFRLCLQCGKRLEDQAGDCPHCGFSSAPPRAPILIGKYELSEEKREGGMGVIWKARNPTSGRYVAVKILKEAYQGDARLRRRFRDEAERASELLHPHIVPVHDVGEHNGDLFFVMPWLPRCLADTARAYVGVPWRAVELLLPIADAMHYLHWRRIVHADLKPDNILLDEHDRPYISDFGVSHRIELDIKDPGSPGRVAGTPGYMAPEQAGAAGGITTGVDVWGLGALLFSLVCGEPPFPTEPEEAAARSLREDPPKNPLALLPGLDADLVAILHRCLQKVPADRYASARDFAEDLRHWRDDEPVRARPIGWPEHAMRWARRHSWQVGLLAAASCFLSVLVSFYLFETPTLERQLRGEVLEANQWAARAHAEAVQAKVKELSALVERAALAAESAGAADSDRWRAIDATLGTENLRKKFDSFLQLDAEGHVYARAPAAPDHRGRSLANRAYVTCSYEREKRNDRRACVTGAYASAIDGAFRFALATFVRVPGGPEPELVVATLNTDSVLLSLLPERPRHGAEGGGPLKVSLVARRDEGPSAEPSREWLLLQHEALPAGATHRVESPVLDAIATGKPTTGRDDHYRDPLLTGRWLAGFAATKNAPWAVIVQSREDAALAPNQRLIDGLILATQLAAAVGVGVGVLAWLLAGNREPRWRRRRRERSEPTKSPA